MEEKASSNISEPFNKEGSNRTEINSINGLFCPILYKEKEMNLI